jgi:hypothetical protein
MKYRSYRPNRSSGSALVLHRTANGRFELGKSEDEMCPHVDSNLNVEFRVPESYVRREPLLTVPAHKCSDGVGVQAQQIYGRPVPRISNWLFSYSL